MKRWMACLLAVILLLLAGCMNHTDPGESSAPTSTQGTEATQPPETEATQPQETENTQPEDLLWAPEPWESLSYEEYFSQPRSASSVNGWTGKDGNAYRLSLSNSLGLTVRQGEWWNTGGKIVYSLENSGELAASGESWVGNGVNGYGILDGGELVQVNLRTGETDTLYTGEKIGWLQFVAQDVLFFTDREREDIVLCRLYLPTHTLDKLARIPAYNENWLSIGWEDTGTFVYSCMNPEFYPLLRDAILDPDCIYRQAEAFREADWLWTEENAAVPEDENSTELLCWVLQYETGVRPLTLCRVNCLTGEIKVKLGVIDGCNFGTGDETHDHYSPDAENQDPRKYGWDVLYP